MTLETPTPSGPTPDLEARRPSEDALPVRLLAAFVVGYVVALWVSAPSVGFTRDEGYYFKAAEEYGAWWNVLFSKRFLDAFSDAEIQRHFSYNTEHPALVKLAQGLSYRILHQWLGVATPSQGFRATGFGFAALALTATFLLGRRLAGGWVGLLAAVLLGLQPRWFYDAHLACFDVPITAMWTLALWAFARALDAPGRRTAALAGVIFGLALATKLNAFFLPFVFVPAWLWHRWGARRQVTLSEGAESVPAAGPAGWFRSGPSGSLDLVLPPIPLVFGALVLVAPLVFIAHWPYLWHDTFPRIGKYLGFHMNHEHYPALYFGRLWVQPPFPISFPLVMTALTVPLPALLLGVLGTLRATRKAIWKKSFEDAILLGATLLPVLIIALPSTPIFGGTKHWYNALPTLCILGAWTLADALRALELERKKRVALAGVLTLAIALPGILGMAASHPNGIGYYNELAGGYKGGAELGMQRGFWGGLAGPLYFDKIIPPRGRIFFNRTNWDAFRMYQREGTIPSTASYANEPRGSTAGVVFEQPEHGEKEAEVWTNCGTRPIGGVYVDNVTLVQLYVTGASTSEP